MQFSTNIAKCAKKQQTHLQEKKKKKRQAIQTDFKGAQMLDLTDKDLS